MHNYNKNMGNLSLECSTELYTMIYQVSIYYDIISYVHELSYVYIYLYYELDK